MPIRKSGAPAPIMGVIAALSLAGCANKFETVTPELQAKFIGDLQQGNLTLDCGVQCSFTWMAQAPSIHPLDMAEKWNDLAVRVMQIGYGNDLAYYYLGQSAQGLGYHRAAIAYYSYAMALSTGPNALLKCEAGQRPNNDPCQGVDIAGSVPVLVQASRDAIAQQVAAATPPPVHHHHHAAPKPASSDWSAPPPAQTSSAGSSSTGSGSDWGAPPPATPPATP